MGNSTFTLFDKINLHDTIFTVNYLRNKILAKGETNMLFLPKEEGQGLVEYALILVLVAIVVIAILMLLGPVIGNVFSTITSGLG